MSFEGYIRRLCPKGHLTEEDVYTENSACCKHCGSVWEWGEVVDCTDGVGQKTPLNIVEKAQWAKCNLGHWHEVEPARYEIPEDNLA